MAKAKSFRSFFDKANGNYDQLSAADKADYLKLVGGDEQKGMKDWNMMKYGPGGGGGGASASAPANGQR